MIKSEEQRPQEGDIQVDGKQYYEYNGDKKGLTIFKFQITILTSTYALIINISCQKCFSTHNKVHVSKNSYSQENKEIHFKS
jgi:hypothetical protein